ncbi:MAG: class I SAM-dependent methyltransferase [Thermoplasmatales archaeon]|nr:class I SAM-dependent methyltransferase [Thermoplasmatales archaeon]
MKKLKQERNVSETEESPLYGSGNPGTYEKVIKLLLEEKNLTAGKMKVLDAPCGGGHLAKELHDHGFQVWASDITRGFFKADKYVVEWREVDLNKSLPYQSSFFNCITSTEGIEHIWDTHHLLGEFARVLKENGIIVISTPNNFSYLSRIHALLYGYYGSFGPYGVLGYRHINSINYIILKYVAMDNGLKIEKITTNRMKHYPLLKTIHKVSRLSSRFVAKLNSKKLDFTAIILKDEKDYKDNLNELSKEELLYGETLIVKMRKIRRISALPLPAEIWKHQ